MQKRRSSFFLPPTTDRSSTIKMLMVSIGDWSWSQGEMGKDSSALPAFRADLEATAQALDALAHAPQAEMPALLGLLAGCLYVETLPVIRYRQS